MAKPALPLVQGTVDVLLLKAASWGSMHGYALSRWIRERSGNALQLDDAALYQALHRLEHQGLLRGEWGQSENNRRARYYSLTTQGRRRLAADISGWQAYMSAVLKVLEAV